MSQARWYDDYRKSRINETLKEGEEMHVNVALLRAKLVEIGLTHEQLAEFIGMDRSTLSRKLSGGGLGFLVGEVHRIIKVLHLTGAEAAAIFFADEVA